MIELKPEEFDLMKCEFCNDHLKKKFLDMKEQLFKIFKNFIKFTKYIKNKDDVGIKKLIDEIGNSQKEFIYYKSLVEKLLEVRKYSKNLEYIPRVRLDCSDKAEIEDLFADLAKRKELLKIYKKNVNELETISAKLQHALETVYLSNSLMSNS